MRKLLLSGLAILFAACLSNGATEMFAGTYQTVEKSLHSVLDNTIFSY
jgi:hypothetical protein